MTYTRLLPLAIAATAAIHPSHASRRADAHEMTIVARDYAFDAPDSAPAGVTTIHLENRGKELHHVVIVRLDSGHTVKEFSEAIQTAEQNNDPLPLWVTFLGGPNPPAP